MRPAAFRLDRRGVSATIGTILMVAITVVLAGVLYLFVSGSLGPAPEAPASVSLDSTGWSGGNYTATVAGVSGTSSIPVDSLSYIVRDKDRVAYLVGPANTPDETNGITTTIFYVDHDNDNRITGGDTIRIQVVPDGAAQVFDGGVFELHYQNRQIALHAL